MAKLGNKCNGNCLNCNAIAGCHRIIDKLGERPDVRKVRQLYRRSARKDLESRQEVVTETFRDLYAASFKDRLKVSWEIMTGNRRAKIKAWWRRLWRKGVRDE